MPVDHIGEEASSSDPWWVSIGPINGLLRPRRTWCRSTMGTGADDQPPRPGRRHGNSASIWPAASDVVVRQQPAGEPMYDPATGRAFDGIEPNGSISHNSGAESVITALLGLMEVLQDPIASEYLRYDEIVEIVGWTQ